MTDMLTSIFESNGSASASGVQFLLCLAAALGIGAILSLVYSRRTRATKSFLMTLGMIPAVVCVVILMVNGNIGTGIAVAGSFSLVRFRSVPGTAKEISMLFLAMGSGMIAGMGYIGYAYLFTILLCLAFRIYDSVDFGQAEREQKLRTMRITIPEDLNYTEIFDDIFEEYTTSVVLRQVKSTNLGSMFRLTYDLTLKDTAQEKRMIDSIRMRNGNLEIVSSRQEIAVSEL